MMEKENLKQPVLATTTTTWFKSLLELADEFEAAKKEYQWGLNHKNDMIMSKAGCLLGYASSAKYILKDNLTNE